MKHTYSRWRHGGWYVHDVEYPSGAIGCVSRNYPDGKWRIVCHPDAFDDQPTFRTRDAAADAELELAMRGTPYEVVFGETPRESAKAAESSHAADHEAESQAA